MKAVLAWAMRHARYSRGVSARDANGAEGEPTYFKPGNEGQRAAVVYPQASGQGHARDEAEQRRGGVEEHGHQGVADGGDEPRGQAVEERDPRERGHKQGKVERRHHGAIVDTPRPVYEAANQSGDEESPQRFNCSQSGVQGAGGGHDGGCRGG